MFQNDAARMSYVQSDNQSAAPLLPSELEVEFQRSYSGSGTDDPLAVLIEHLDKVHSLLASTTIF